MLNWFKTYGKWLLGLVVRMALCGGFYAWYRLGWALQSVPFDLDWLVWAGAVVALYLVWRQLSLIWREPVTVKTKIRFYHHLLNRIPIVSTITQYQFRRGHNLGVLQGADSMGKMKGNAKHISQRKLKRALEAEGL